MTCRRLPRRPTGTSRSTAATRDSRWSSRYVHAACRLPSSAKANGHANPQFVQSLANPFYLNHLASQKLLTQPAFVAYLAYLQYWSRPPYLKYLTYPGPTLRHLELLQQERFRQDIMSPDLVQRLVEEGMRSAVQWHKEGAP